MTKLKINYWFKRDKQGKYDSFKAWFHRLTFRVIATLVFVAIFSAGTAFGGAIFSTSEVHAEYTTKTTLDSRVLNRIADCESGNGKAGTATHYDKNGQVLLRGNTNKTVDVGKYQVNSVWFKKATELGYDITTEAGNKAMAEWIYLNRGTGDWYSSESCWK